LRCVTEDIWFADTPTVVNHKVGETCLLQCDARATPEPRVSWHFDDKDIVADGVKYALVADNGLVVNDVQRTDNGTYECRAEVPSYGAAQTRYVQLNVLCEFCQRFTPAYIQHTHFSQHVRHFVLEKCICNLYFRPDQKHNLLRLIIP